MHWREKRRADLEQNLETILVRLGEYEANLIDETDPSQKNKLKNIITNLREQMNDIDSQLMSLEQKDNSHMTSAILMSGLTYDDISFVISALLNQDTSSVASSDNFDLTYPEKKMSKNDLTHEVRYLLRTSLAKAGEVRHFIENNAKIHFPDVPERLKNALNTEYTQLVSLGIRGDDLFNKMCSFSHQNNSNEARRSAGLAVLCYFFETCDVFER